MDWESFDLTSMQIADSVFGQQTGRGILKVHPRSKCEGRGIPCCIHQPSDHHMKTWQMNWRGDTSVMERLCPHGIGHPDPDHMAYVKSLTPEHDCIYERYSFSELWDSEELGFCKYPHLDWQGSHGCDGCCVA